MTRLTRKQLQAIHARKNEILRQRAVVRQKEILKEFKSDEFKAEPFTVKHSKNISQSDLIGMQRAAGVR